MLNFDAKHLVPILHGVKAYNLSQWSYKFSLQSMTQISFKEIFSCKNGTEKYQSELFFPDLFFYFLLT